MPQGMTFVVGCSVDVVGTCGNHMVRAPGFHQTRVLMSFEHLTIPRRCVSESSRKVCHCLMLVTIWNVLES